MGIIKSSSNKRNRRPKIPVEIPERAIQELQEVLNGGYTAEVKIESGEVIVISLKRKRITSYALTAEPSARKVPGKTAKQ
jgi:hypothetical protein